MLKLFGRKPKPERKVTIIDHPTAPKVRASREERLKRATFAYGNAVVTVLTEHNIGATLADRYISPRFLGIGVRLETSTDFDKAIGLGDAIAYTAGAVEVIPVRLGKYIYYQFTLPKPAWMKVQQSQDWVGLGARNAVEKFRFEDAPHTLIAGMTDCGKTVLTQSILVSLTYRYTEEELGVYLIDPHGDHEEFDSWTYLEYAVARSDDDITRLATLIELELDRRTTEGLRDEKRALIVVDEAERVFMDQDVLKRLARVSKEGRKFNMHLLISTQKPDHTNLAGILPGLGNRYFGRMSSAAISGVYGSGMNLHRLTGQGDFIHVAGSQFHRFTAAITSRAVLETLPAKEVRAIPTSEFLQDPVDMAQAKPAHRPVITATPDAVAFYIKMGPDNVTIAQAREALGLKRTGHYVNRDFAKRLLEIQEET